MCGSWSPGVGDSHRVAAGVAKCCSRRMGYEGWAVVNVNIRLAGYRSSRWEEASSRFRGGCRAREGLAGRSRDYRRVAIQTTSPLSGRQEARLVQSPVPLSPTIHCPAFLFIAGFDALEPFLVP